MKIGVKTFFDEDFLKYFKNKSDFFEVQAILKKNYDFVKRFEKIEVIHSEHQGFGINPADKKKYEKNLKSINFAIKTADSVNAKKIIAHPGVLENDSCSYEQSIDFFKNINDNRILIENLPERDNGSFCTTPEETIEFLKLTNKKFCLDINHAIQTALQKNIDYIELLKGFIKIKPSHYHLGGQRLNFNDNAHRSFSDSDLNLKEILSILPKDAEITLEVTIDIKETEKDLMIIKKTLSLPPLKRCGLFSGFLDDPKSKPPKLTKS